MLLLLTALAALTYAQARGWCAMETIAEPVLTVPRSIAPPSIDGRLDEEAWQWAATIYGLPRQADGEPAEDYTRIWLTYDDQNLYLALKCYASEKQHQGVAEEWRKHERVVVDFLADGNYFAFRFNSKDGEVTAPEGPPAWWGEGCKSKVRLEADGWQFEAAIPFARFNVGCPEPGTIWGFNVDRQERKRREDDSIWCEPYVGMDYDSSRMGQIIFAGEDALTSSVVSVGERQIGDNQMTVEISNRGRARAMVTASVGLTARKSEPHQHDLEIGAGERREVRIPYSIRDGGPNLLLTVSQAATGETVCRQEVALNLARNRAMLTAVGRQLRRLRRSGGGALDELIGALETRRRALLERASAPAVSRDQWVRLAGEVGALALDVSKAGWRASGPDCSRPYEACAYGPLTTVFRDEALPPGAQREIELWACRNERECAQLVLLSIEEGLQDVRLEADDLKGARGLITRENVEMSLVDYVEVKRTRYRQERLGWYPDPLLPLEPFDVVRDSLQPVWVAVYVPPGTAAGDYEGEIRVIPQNARVVTVPVRLHVWDFELPVRPALRTSFALFESEMNRFYGWTGDVPQELRRQHYDLLLNRRIAPGCCYSEFPVPRIEDLDYCVERGLNAITLGYVPADWQAKLDQVQAYLDRLKQKGWYDLAWIYGFDEVGESGYARVREIYGKVAERYPGLNRAVTLGSVANPDLLGGAVDIFIQETDRYREDLKRRQEAGDEVWVYLSMWPRRPYANAFVDYPRIDQRIVPWQCWKCGVDGFMYYAINIWWTNCTWEPDLQGDSRVHADARLREAIRAGKRYPEIPWNTYCGDGAMMGDGQLVYPGRNGRLLSSTRLEAMSQGIEDYDYLALLGRLTEDLRVADKEGKHAAVLHRCEELLAVRAAVAADWIRYTKDPTVLEAERRAVAEQILEVQRLLGRGG